MTELTIETKVWACTDAESSRYALSAVKAIPKTGGVAWIVATDGRCLSVTPVDGTCDETTLIPADVIKGPLPVIVKCVNGEWRNNRGRIAPPPAGKFPDIAKTFEQVACASIKGRTSIAFNPRLATAIRNAVQESDLQAASMYIADDQSAIAVLGLDGFGLLMPMATDAIGLPNDAESCWRNRTKAFLSDWAKAHPTPLAPVKAARKKAAPRKKAAKKAAARK
jgi:hypothetical protein